MDIVSRSFSLGEEKGGVVFSIPGFRYYHCDSCHKAEELLERSGDRMRSVLKRLRAHYPHLKEIPFRQYIIQPWADELLSPRQFAHTTFDTIRIFPRTIIIDAKVYGNATQLHETLHLTQKFIGAPNELEAYGLNILSDPRFLILNFPYFQDVVTTFFEPGFPGILDEFFKRPVKENLDVPREVQWFMNPFPQETLDRLARTVEAMKPLLLEASRISREQPMVASYLSAQTGNVALILEIAAAKLLPIPPDQVPRLARKKAFAVINQQIRKTDNTRLGYKIDRKKEALLTLQHMLKIQDPIQRLSLYFQYLRAWFLDPEGNVRLVVEDAKDLAEYTEKQIQQIWKLGDLPQLTPLEKEAAHRWIEMITRDLQVYIEDWKGRHQKSGTKK